VYKRQGYAAGDKRLALVAALAHEMQHHRQHKERKAAHGPGYCASPAYAAEKPQLEEEADSFGDAVAALFFVGRDVEVVNECAAPAAVYVEADEALTAPGAPAFTDVAALSRARLALKAVSGRVRYYAETAPEGGVRSVWRGADKADLRFIAGRPYALRRARLPAAAPTQGPFRLRLCADEQRESMR
jgi:hypothetical protein